MADRLRIYACTGVSGSEEQQMTYDYWRDNVNVLKQTQAVNTLMTYIDTCDNTLKYEKLTKRQVIETLNKIDLYAVCIYYAQEYSGNKQMLSTAGQVIGAAVKAGLFTFNSTDAQDRDEYLDLLYEKMDKGIKDYLSLTTKGTTKKIDSDKTFDQWWLETVISRDKVGMSAAQYDAFMSNLRKGTKGISGSEKWEDNEVLNKYLNHAGDYFLYLYFTPEQMAHLDTISNVFRKKRNYQQVVYNNCIAYYVNVYGSQEQMNQVIRNNIIETLGHTPEAICKKIASGEKIQGVGGGIVWTAAAIVKLIGIILTTIVSVISAILSYKKTVDAAKYQKFNESLLDQNAAEEADLKGMKFINATDWTKYALIGAAILGMVWISKKN